MRRPANRVAVPGLLPALIGSLLLAGAGTGCEGQDPEPGPTIGLLLSYSGLLAANSVNSERAVWMAIEAVNRAGGVGGRPVTLLARDTGSDARRVGAPARELLDAGAAVIIGPDTVELGVELKGLLADRTVMMPSYATADSTIYKPHTWFVMGAPAARMACELVAQLRADRRARPLAIRDTNGYNVQLGFQLASQYGIRTIEASTEDLAEETIISTIVAGEPDALVLATLPSTASSLVYALAAVGRLEDPMGWYLAPTLHTPALLATIPRGSLDGARGVATGTVAGAGDFRQRFVERWQDTPLDDAYPFYDAAAIAALALQRAIVRDGAIPTGAGLGPHIVAVTRKGKDELSVSWSDLERGLTLLAEGKEVSYQGLSGVLEFDTTGQTRTTSTNWWTIGPDGFQDIASESDCL